EDGIRDFHVTGVQTCALPISGDSLESTFSCVGTSVNSAVEGRSFRRVAGRPTLLAMAVAAVLAGASPDSAVAAGLGRLTVESGRSEERRVGDECSCGWR